jgi:hypothetical protein
MKRGVGALAASKSASTSSVPPRTSTLSAGAYYE